MDDELARMFGERRRKIKQAQDKARSGTTHVMLKLHEEPGFKLVPGGEERFLHIVKYVLGEFPSAFMPQ